MAVALDAAVRRSDDSRAVSGDRPTGPPARVGLRRSGPQGHRRSPRTSPPSGKDPRRTPSAFSRGGVTAASGTKLRAPWSTLPPSPPSWARPTPARPTSPSSACSPHDTGMIGLPLRLLAREVYDRVSHRRSARPASRSSPARRSASPTRPRYWVCTVEAMPVERRGVDFLAIDEIQLAGAPRARPRLHRPHAASRAAASETMFLGADTMRRRARGSCRPRSIDAAPARFSRLAHAGADQAHEAAAALGRRRVLGRRGLRASPSSCARQRGGCGGGDGGALARAPATPRSPSTSRARSTTSSPPTRSAWGSTSTSTTSRSRRSASSTGARRATSTPPSSRRSPAARAGYTADGTFGTAGARCRPCRRALAAAIEAHQFPAGASGCSGGTASST